MQNVDNSHGNSRCMKIPGSNIAAGKRLAGCRWPEDASQRVFREGETI